MNPIKKSIMRYFGGKQKLASKIVKYLPKHTVYVEPFCGACSVMFHKSVPNVTNDSHYREVINDADNRLISFYRVLQSDKKDELLDRLQLTLYSREEHRLATSILKGETISNNIEMAWAYYVSANMSFGGGIESGWGVDKYTTNSGKRWVNKVLNLSEFINRLKAVSIECDNAINVIKRWDSPHTLFYCDPPYINTAQKYKHTYSIDNYKELIDTLSNAKGSFALSGYNNKYVPKEWRKVVFKATMSFAYKKDTDRKREEYLWVVDRSDTVRDEIKKIFESEAFKEFNAGRISI